MHTWIFTYGEHHAEVQGNTIFDAMVEFHAFFSDARLDVDDLNVSRFDQLTNIDITRAD